MSAASDLLVEIATQEIQDLQNERDRLLLALEVTKEAAKKIEAERDEAQRALAAIVINAERASVVINDSGDEPAERTLSRVLQAVRGGDSEGARSYFRKIQAERDEYKACWHRDLAKARAIEADLRETAELHRKDAVTLHKQRDAACTEAAELRAKLAVAGRDRDGLHAMLAANRSNCDAALSETREVHERQFREVRAALGVPDAMSLLDGARAMRAIYDKRPAQGCDPHVRLTTIVDRLESAFLDVSPEHGEMQRVARVMVRDLRSITDDLLHARSTTRDACEQLKHLIKAFGR